MRGLQQTVHACPLAYTTVADSCYSLRHPVVREPIVSDCSPTRSVCEKIEFGIRGYVRFIRLDGGLQEAC
jgi:hypothetical protein